MCCASIVDEILSWISSFELNGKKTAMLAQFTPAVLRKVVSRVADKSDAEARTARLSFLRLLCVLCEPHIDALYSKRIVEAGILPVCVAIMHEDPPAELAYDELLQLCMQLLTNVVQKLYGLHPFLSAGVLLPHLFSALQRDRSNRPFHQAVVFVTQYGCRRGHARSVSLRPIIFAPATARAAEGASQQGLLPLSQMVPIHGVDSDSLCIISSFLCGCDFLRVIRVCRRWSGLCLKPTAWPSAQPCDAHSPQHVDAISPLYLEHDLAPLACLAFSDLSGTGVRRLLDLGVLDLLLPHLDEACDSDLRQSSALDILQQIGQTEGGVHAPLLASRGIVGSLGELVRRHDRDDEDSFRGKACAVLAVVLRGCTSVEVDIAVQDDLLSVLVAFASRDRFHRRIVAEVLMWMCLRGTEAHRRALVVGEVLPLLSQVVQREALRSAARRTEDHGRLNIGLILDLLRSISLLLRTAKSLDAEADAALPPAAAAKTTKAQRISRAGFEALQEHWHPEVRAELAKLLREHFD
jgi:hypothetical protein